jgi:hypothetical protein
MKGVAVWDEFFGLFDSCSAVVILSDVGFVVVAEMNDTIIGDQSLQVAERLSSDWLTLQLRITTRCQPSSLPDPTYPLTSTPYHRPCTSS